VERADHRNLIAEPREQHLHDDEADDPQRVQYALPTYPRNEREDQGHERAEEDQVAEGDVKAPAVVVGILVDGRALGAELLGDVKGAEAGERNLQDDGGEQHPKPIAEDRSHGGPASFASLDRLTLR
jgi:hypothetical protein